MGLRMCTRTRFRFLLFRNLVQGGHSSSKQAGSASLFTSSSTSLDITILYFFYFADSLHTTGVTLKDEYEFLKPTAAVNQLRIISRRADAMKMPLESSINRIKLNSTNEEDEGAVSLRPEEKEAREDQTYDLGYLKKPRFALTGKTIKELKFSNKSDLSQEQIEALQEAWNHIRAGALDPEPVKKLVIIFYLTSGQLE
ncbi:hypothetical protein H0E87_009741 [Populus deltoides]|uniref:Uncharacterized protein n=1 Tax=Populus deltoides TaxID=3696 RepID=A0A8T2YQL8_POPDE|nr:hypothetical protein H0E87_009741 [Populus deltoides]